MSRAHVLVAEATGASQLAREVDRLLRDDFQLSHLSAEKLYEPLAPSDVSPQAIMLLADAAIDFVAPLMERIRLRFPTVPVLLAADCGEAEPIRQTLESGVHDYVAPPLRKVDLLPRLWRLVGRGQESDDVRRRLKQKLGLRRLVGESQPFLNAIAKIPLFAKYDGTVLIEGETGTGKGVVARAIHHLSSRANKPFIPVNCGALPGQLMENELFGHSPGAFTGASTSRHGLVHEAAGGTLFLDEIDCLSLQAQAKLLRLLQERDYRPLGATRSRKADIRVIAAANVDLAEAVRKRVVREDLYYRVHVLPLSLPPLRDRDRDILLLARHFLAVYSQRLASPQPLLSPPAAHLLLSHGWPGNVRELEHVIERAIVLADGRSLIETNDLDLNDDEPRLPLSFREAKARVVEDFERSYLLQALESHDGNITRAAASAGKNRRAFWELMRKHGIEASRPS